MDYKKHKIEKDTEYRRRHINLDFALKPEGRKPLSEGSKNRQTIQHFIFETCFRVKDVEKALAIVEEKFSDCKYDSYRPFFKMWVRHGLGLKEKDDDKENEEER